jgi:hypothetical protein
MTAFTYRAAVLAHLAEHPGLTANEIQQAIRTRGSLTKLLRQMEQRTEVVAQKVRRQGQCGLVRVWSIAPAGTVPPPKEPESQREADQRRARQRTYQRARRARLVTSAVLVPYLPPGAACAGADPEIFFPPAHGDETEAVANRERYGIWAGINFETGRPAGQARAS